MVKSRLINLPKEKLRAEKPMKRVNMDLVSSSVLSIEGHKYALGITDCCTGYRWLYGLKTKDDTLKVVQKWYSDIADLREKHTIYVVMLDNSGENKSQKICDFFESKRIQNYYSTLFEQWQNGQPESSINSLLTLARSTLVEWWSLD
jgi:hypothetical protein